MPRRIPAPATKVPELIEKLNSIALGAEVDDLALRRIEQEARGMMVADPIGAHTVFGAIAALNGHTEDVRDHFRIALQQSGNSAEVFCNYSTALLNLGETVEALETARQAYQLAPDNPGVLRHLVTAAVQAAKFREAHAHWNRLVQLAPQHLPPDESIAVPLGEAVERGVFREESVQELLQVVHEILKSAGIRRIAESVLMADHTDPDSFLYLIRIFASPDRAADLNELLANRLADQSDLMVDPGTRFVPMFIGIRVDDGHSRRAV